MKFFTFNHKMKNAINQIATNMHEAACQSCELRNRLFMITIKRIVLATQNTIFESRLKLKSMVIFVPSGELSNPGSFFKDLNYKYFNWWEAGTKIAGGNAGLPSNLPKYLQGLNPKALLNNSFPKPSDLNPMDWLKNASVSATAFYVFDWDVFGGDSIDRNFAAGEMFGSSPGGLGILTRNVMLSELLEQ